MITLVATSTTCRTGHEVLCAARRVRITDRRVGVVEHVAEDVGGQDAPATRGTAIGSGETLQDRCRNPFLYLYRVCASHGAFVSQFVCWFCCRAAGFALAGRPPNPEEGAAQAPGQRHRAPARGSGVWVRHRASCYVLAIACVRYGIRYCCRTRSASSRLRTPRAARLSRASVCERRASQHGHRRDRACTRDGSVQK